MKKIILIISLILFASITYAADRVYELSWDPNPESDLDHYNIYVSTNSGDYSTPYGDTKNTSFQLILPDDTPFYIVISAVDKGGLESGFSEEVDTARPSIPGGCRIKEIK